MCDCAGGPTIVTDWSSGDVLCSACGVVMEGHILDETPEWRRHDDDARREADHIRVGNRAPATHQDRHLQGTYLEMPRGATGRKRRCCGIKDTPKQQALKAGLDAIDVSVVAFGLGHTSQVAVTARELFEHVHAIKGVRSDVRDAYAASALYFGFKLEGVARELRLVAAMCGVEPRALNAAINDFKDVLRDKPYYHRLFAPLQAGKLIDIFLDRLRLPPDQRKRVWRTAHALDESMVTRLDCGRKPRTICSGLLYIACQREGVEAVTKKHVMDACDVCQQTLDKIVAHMLESPDPV